MSDVWFWLFSGGSCTRSPVSRGRKLPLTRATSSSPPPSCLPRSRSRMAERTRPPGSSSSVLFGEPSGYELPLSPMQKLHVPSWNGTPQGLKSAMTLNAGSTYKVWARNEDDNYAYKYIKTLLEMWTGSVFFPQDYSVPEISLFPEENAEGKKVVFRDTSEDARIFGFPIKANSIIINAGLWVGSTLEGSKVPQFGSLGENTWLWFFFLCIPGGWSTPILSSKVSHVSWRSGATPTLRPGEWTRPTWGQCTHSK